MKEVIVKATKKAVMWTGKNAPHILFAFGVVGVIGAAVMAIKKTPEVTEMKKNLDDNGATKMEKFKAIAPKYIPAATVGVASIVCLIGANSIQTKRNAAAMAALKLGEEAFKEYKDAVKQNIGEKAEEDIRNAIAKKRVEEKEVVEDEIIETGAGTTLCYDKINGRYFRSDKDLIVKAVNDLNREIIIENYMTLNDLFDRLGLPSTIIGDELGWHVDTGLIEPSFSSQLATNGEPCLVLMYTLPKSIYSFFE